MRLKTFRAFTLAEALDAVHDDLGRDAAVLHTRTFRRGGFLGIGGREVVEVIASEGRPETSILPAVTRPRASVDSSSVEEVGSEASAPASEPSTPIAVGVSARARAAYSSTSTSAGAEDSEGPSASGATPEPVDDAAPVTSASLEVDRARTRSLARAMALRLERQQAARAAAGVSNADDLVGGRETGEPSAATSCSQSRCATPQHTPAPSPNSTSRSESADRVASEPLCGGGGSRAPLEPPPRAPPKAAAASEAGGCLRSRWVPPKPAGASECRGGTCER